MKYKVALIYMPCRHGPLCVPKKEVSMDLIATNIAIEIGHIDHQSRCINHYLAQVRLVVVHSVYYITAIEFLSDEC